MDFDSLLALASARRWDELTKALQLPANRPLWPGVVRRFEELGDGCLSSGSVLEATRYFSAATMCAMGLLYAPASGEDPAWLVAPFTRLSEKGPAARRRFEKEQGADFDRVKRKVVVSPPSPPIAEKKAAMPAPEPKMVLEALLGKLEKLAREKRTASWVELLRKDENHDSCRAIAERFEALGDEHGEKEQAAGQAIECYRVASLALNLSKLPFVTAGLTRLDEKRHKIEEAILDEKIAHPVESDLDPAALGQDMDSVERLVLARRFGEAGRLLTQVWHASHDKSPLGRLEATGDRLARKHPELARWYYQKFHRYAMDIPGDRAGETRIRDSVIHTAGEKLRSVKPPRPKRRATIQLSLAGWGNPTSSSPGPEISMQTVRDDGMLELTPEWVFTHYQEEGGRALRPEQWPARYRYRVLVSGRQVQLTQVDDRYGRSQPFDFGTLSTTSAATTAATSGARRVPPFRLKLGKPVTIRCQVAGGGPEWTLTLSTIATTPA